SWAITPVTTSNTNWRSATMRSNPAPLHFAFAVWLQHIKLGCWARGARQPAKAACLLRYLGLLLIRRIPTVLDVRNKSWNDDDSLRPLSEDLVGDMRIAILGLSNFRRPPRASTSRSRAVASPSGRWIMTCAPGRIEW